jgi:predicted deacetylase
MPHAEPPLSRQPGPRRQLLASVHDVSPRFEGAVDGLSERLERLLGAPRFAMLVVPDFWGESPISRAPAFRARLRAWSDRGIEMFLHGWSHRDDVGHRGRLASFKARRMTAGEGEFLGLDRAEAGRRMRDGRAVVEDAIGRPVTGFVAPAWLYGDGARSALEDQGFALAEDHFRVWRPADGFVLSRGPVVTWASRSRARRASSIAFAALARAALRPMPVVRVAVHPGDAAHPNLTASIENTISSLLSGRTPGRYADLGRSRALRSIPA